MTGTGRWRVGDRKALRAARLAAGGPTTVENASHLLPAEQDDALQGFTYLIAQPGGRVLLDNLHVRPARKRSGIRAFGWAAAHHPGKAVHLEVLRDNAPAGAKCVARPSGGPAGSRLMPERRRRS
ncbi:hypothetical protein ACIBI9_63875 [Nonomuraea sp. NPDC050451]|uniref:hypothetical protein n=1 Tax=Nonomuraea sp. NPDC050451 TaxID=3364364 RepID=UPI0037B3AE6C